MRNEEYFEHLSSYENMKDYIEELSWEHDFSFSSSELQEILQNIFDVKFADRIHNLSTQWDENNLEKVERKVEETRKYFLDIASKVNPEAYKKLKSLILELEIKLA
jgi:predicted small metal-binding protein